MNQTTGATREGDMVERLAVGEVFEAAKGAPDMCGFQLDDGGAVFAALYRSPRAKEIKAFRQGKVEFRFLPLRESIFILAKVGDLRWQEAAFDPHMCKNLTSILTDVPDGLGMSILLLLADTATGLLKCTRFISAGTEFTRQFFAEAKARWAAPFDERAWRAGLLDVQSRYSTEDMAEMALSRYQVGTRG